MEIEDQKKEEVSNYECILATERQDPLNLDIYFSAHEFLGGRAVTQKYIDSYRVIEFNGKMLIDLGNMVLKFKILEMKVEKVKVTYLPFGRSEAPRNQKTIPLSKSLKLKKFNSPGEWQKLLKQLLEEISNKDH